MSLRRAYKGKNRRKIPRKRDSFFRFVVGLNVLAWGVFVISMILFHYARPELISGVQEYWGMEGRDNWSETLSFYLIALLTLCFVLALAVLLMRRKRSRRKHDYFGMNVIILIVISASSLTWILTSMNWT